LSDSELDQIRAIVADLQAIVYRHHAGVNKLDMHVQEDSLAEVAKYQYVESHIPIGWPELPPGIIPKFVVYVKKIVRRLLRWYVNPIVDQQNTYNAAIAKALAQLDARRNQLERRLEAKFVEIRQSQVQGMQNIEQMRQFMQEIDQSGEGFAMRLRRLEHWQRREKASDSTDQSTATAPFTASPGVDYFLLGAKYRNPKQMTAFLNDYDDIFTVLRDAQQQGEDPTGPVLDIGCGRGEFVAHLAELGLSAYGIDIDVDGVEMGQEMQRDVREADAFAHLSSLSDASLAAVTLIQVIEHFEIEDTLRLFRLIFQKLAAGGFVLAETINPTCLLAFSNWFLLDPSHRTPLHPQMTKFLMEQAEFEHASIRFLHPVPDGGKLTLLPILEDRPELRPWAEYLNRNFERLNEFLYGHQDYAVIGYKDACDDGEISAMNLD
jgi:O-antigen chain-terminating methyltransferase